MKRPDRNKFPHIPDGIFDHENWGGDDYHDFKRQSSFRVIIFKLLFVVLFIGIIFTFIQVSDNRIVSHTCIVLENQSKEFDNFFITQWQKDMCDRYGFKFAGTKNAPVHVETMGGKELELGVWYTNDWGKWIAEVNHN